MCIIIEKGQLKPEAEVYLKKMDLFLFKQTILMLKQTVMERLQR